jgi:hypothetical protein
METKNIIESNEYLSLSLQDSGLLVTVTSEGKEFLEESIEDDYFARFEEIFESINVNSEWEFHRDLGDSGFGLTSADGFSNGYHYNDEGDYEGHEDSEVYFNNNYAIKSFVEELINEGSYFFNKA